jgi:hypothetical protein
MESERIEEFTRDGKSFVYLDVSWIKANDAFAKVVEDSKPIIQSYEGRDLYTITNIEGVMFDSKTKKLAADWTAHNKPFVKFGVIIGMDSIRQIMVNAVFALSGRKNMHFASTKEEAIEWLLKQK